MCDLPKLLGPATLNEVLLVLEAIQRATLYPLDSYNESSLEAYAIHLLFDN